MGFRLAGESHNPLIMQQRAMHLYPSLSTERRWHELFTIQGIRLKYGHRLHQTLETTIERILFQ